jgi:hypothetical protein
LPTSKATDSSGNTWNIAPVPLEFAPPSSAHVDLFSVANALFGCESLILQGHALTSVEIPLYGDYAASLDVPLQRMFELVLDRPVRIAFTGNTEGRQLPLSAAYGGEPLTDGYTCLFSTGTDSYSTILNAAAQFRNLKGCFVSHNDLRSLRGLGNDFAEHLSSQKGIEVARINAAEHGQYIRRSRGVFYVLYGLLLGTKNVIMGETGVTMYQPKFTLLDEVTITAHPLLLSLVADLTRKILGEKPKIILPCESLTKAEVVAACPERGMLAATFSCSGTTMFATSEGANCGTCFSCIVRRLAFLVCGEQDCFYPYDVTGAGAREQALDNILHLLRFSVDYARDRDAVPWYTQEILKRYGRTDLFERFALDNLAGLMLLSERGGINSALGLMREVSRRKVDDSLLRERIEVVRSRAVKMNFRKVL